MTKYYYTKEHVQHIIDTLGLSNRKFCRETGVNRGDLSRFMRGLKGLSDLNSQKIYKFAKEHGFYQKKKKSIWQRIVDFIKG